MKPHTTPFIGNYLPYLAAARFRLLLFALLIGVATMPAQAQNKKDKGKKEKTDKNKLSEAELQRVQKLFFDGLLANIKSNSQGAIDAFKQCLTIQPNHDAAMFELARMYYEKQDPEQTLFYAEKAANIDPHNKWYQALYAEALSVNNRFVEAAKIYEQLTLKYPTEYDYYFDWAYMLIQANKYGDAINVYDALELKLGTLEDISVQKQKLYLRLGQFDKAVAELQKLSNANPNEVRYALTLAELYQANNMPDKALEVYNQLLKTSPDNPYANLALADYYSIKGDQTLYLEYLAKALQNPELAVNIKAQRLQPMVERKAPTDKDKNLVFKMVETVLKAHPDEPLAHILYADLLYTYDQKEKSLDEFTKASQLDGSSYDVWNQMMMINYELKNHLALNQLTTQVIELFPNQPMPYYFNGIANQQLKNYEKAIKALKQGALVSVTDENLTAQMHSLIGTIYNDIKEYDKSDSNFEKALHLSPDDALILNNYSYFLSVRGENLDKAAEMSLKSNKLEPNNASFEDTYAWVLYKQKKYTEARKWIEKALTNSGNKNATLLEHYGDILFKLNETDKAVENWKAAKENGSTSELLDKKIKDQKLYE